MPIKVKINAGPLTGLFNRAKAGAHGMSEAARDSMAALSVKASETITAATLHRTIADLENEIDLQLCDIGRLVYATHCGNPSDSEEVQKILEYVDGLFEEIEGHERQLELMQGTSVCSVCGRENSTENTYCEDCGQPLSHDSQV